MLALRLPKDIEDRLNELAKKTGRTKSFYAREAILEHLADLEDAYLANDRVTNSASYTSLDDVVEELGIEN